MKQPRTKSGKFQAKINDDQLAELKRMAKNGASDNELGAKIYLWGIVSREIINKYIAKARSL